MLRYLALTLLVGCSASAGGASFGDDPGRAIAAPEQAAAGASIGGGTSAGGPSAGGSSAGAVVAEGGQTPEPSAGAPAAGAPSSAGSGGATAGAGSPSAAGQAGAPTAGAPSACPADFYCHELGPDAFAACVIQDQPDDPDFPGCKITRGACFYPATAPESCVKAECWKKMRTCD